MHPLSLKVMTWSWGLFGAVPSWRVSGTVWWSRAPFTQPAPRADPPRLSMADAGERPARGRRDLRVWGIRGVRVHPDPQHRAPPEPMTVDGGFSSPPGSGGCSRVWGSGPRTAKGRRRRCGCRNSHPPARRGARRFNGAARPAMAMSPRVRRPDHPSFTRSIARDITRTRPSSWPCAEGRGPTTGASGTCRRSRRSQRTRSP